MKIRFLFYRLRKLFSALLAVSLVGVISVGAAALPVGAQVPLEATKDLTFSLRVTGGISPVASITMEVASLCLLSDGVTVSAAVGGKLTVISHEELSTACIHDIYIAFPGFTGCMASVTKTGSNVILSRNITGSRTAVSVLSVKSQGTIDFRAANIVGALKAINRDGIDITDGNSLSALTVTVNNCQFASGSTGSNILVVNPEPAVEMRADFQTLRGCVPSFLPVANEILSADSSRVSGFDTNCIWKLDFDDNTLECTATAHIYLAGETAPRSVIGSRSTMQSVRFSSGGVDVFYDGRRVAAIILQRGSRCVTSFRVELRVLAPDGFGNMEIPFRIFPTNSSRGNGCTEVTLNVSARETVVAYLLSRGRLSSVTCRYAYTVPQYIGGLQLAESESIRQDITFFRGEHRSVVDFTTKSIPVNVYSVFPTRVNFSSTDVVAYRISSPSGNCGSVQNSFGSLNAAVGVYRTFQALPGTAKLLGENADTRGGGEPYIYALPSSLVSAGNFGAQSEIACTAVVSASRTPSGCSVANNGGKQEVTATDSSESFDFYFIYTCGGVTGVLSGELVPTTTTATTTTTTTVRPTTRTLRLNKGWHLYAFNGATATTPADFLSPFGSKVKSIWEWNAQTQSWNGYNPGQVNELTRLTNGREIFMYVPEATSVVLNPGTLLTAQGSESGVTLKSGLNMIVYKGRTQTIAAAFSNENVAGVFRWSNSAQDWDNYYRDGVPSSRRFSSLNYGDVLFVYSTSSSDIRIFY